ncbi:MAG TPA: SLBB domain-containing protein [Candidatus Acidoferrales bacterium]|nr:SLBB domain-containing protein [Candidatus Acidoferrales bacterium]
MKSKMEAKRWIAAAGWIAVLAMLVLAITPTSFAQINRVAAQNGKTAVQSPQTNAPGTPQATPAQAATPAAGTAMDLPRGGDLILGPGDIIQIQVANDPDISGKYLISQSGDLRVPTIPRPIHAMDLSTSQLSDRISKALVQAQILKEPVVSIFVDEYHSHTVTVVGAVQKPGIYPVEVNTTVLQAITEAGGLLTTAGSSVTVTRAKAEEKSAGPAKLEKVNDSATQLTVSVADMVAGRNGAANVMVHAGDVVNVGTAPIVYVVGAVTRPGAFAIQSNNSEITVLQALALVEGVTPVASAKRAIIVRDSTDPKNRKEIPVNIPKMMSGKEADQYLVANDILFIPESGLKKTLHRMGDVAIGAATEVAGYGSALRVAAF